MFKFNLKSLYRGLVRDKLYSFLNLLGLSIGISTSLLVLLYVQDEVSYDMYNINHDRIYRLESEFGTNGKLDHFAIFPIPLGPAYKINIPEVEEVTRFGSLGSTPCKYQNKEYYENNLMYADSTVFKVFSYSLIQGNPITCLSEVNTAVFTKTMAEKYFGDEDPMGKIVRIERNSFVRITGIMEDLPDNSHLNFDGLVSMATLANSIGSSTFNSMEPNKFWRIGQFTYMLLKENSSIEDFEAKAVDFYEENMKPTGEKYNLTFSMLYTKLADTHFRKGLGGELPSGNKNNIWIFSIMAAFVLLIACINYMNMATARSAKRAREVGIRKVLGAYKAQLINQFLFESIALSLFSLGVSIFVVWLILPEFGDATGKYLAFSFVKSKVVFLWIFLITIIVGIVSGSYPAFFLSSFQPVIVLKGAISNSGKRGGVLRKILVIVQFFLAISMVIGALVVSHQLHFLKNKDIGFDKNSIVIIGLTDSTFRSNAISMKKELLVNSNVISITNSQSIPGFMNRIRVMEVEQDNGMENKSVIYCKTDYDFVRTYGMEIIQGRDFNEEMGQDKLEAVIINEKAAKDFGWGEDALGKKIHFGYKADGTGGRMLKVIGVVRDFNFKSMYNKIEPIIFLIKQDPGFFLSCRINEKNEKAVLEFIEEKYIEFGPVGPFEYSFISDDLDAMYFGEEKSGWIINGITMLIIFIALLGLMGLSSFIAEQKSCEIGVRKVMGGSTHGILLMLYREFALLILISFVLAVPLAWWGLNDWLNTNFVYHIHLHWVYFLIAGLGAFIVGLGTISYFIIKAASLNPVDAIKRG